MKSVTNEKYAEFVNALSEGGGRCMWQIPPSSLAKIGMPNMGSIECWQTPTGMIILTAWKGNNGFTYYRETQEGEMTKCFAELGFKKVA